MLRAISTHVFLRQRLHPGLLETLTKGGAQGIEIFAARQHFDYTSKPHVKEIALWFSSNPTEPFSMHMPLFGDTEMGRSGAPGVNVVHPEKSRRIDAMDEVKRAADEYNKMGALAAQAGIQQGLHNEDFELSMVAGKRTYDVLFGLLDPKLVKFQFQVSTISKGYDAAEYFTKYPGRFISMHVQGWSAEAKKIMPVGQDSLDWKKIFAAAKIGGIQNYFVEMDLEKMKSSVPYLRQLQV